MLCARHLLHVPGCLVLAHGVEDRQELAHAGRQRYLLGFARGAQALVKGFEHRIIADGHEGTHVQGRPHLCASTPGGASPRRVPLSRLRGATPTRAAMRWRLKVPNSGRSSSKVQVHTEPMKARESTGLTRPQGPGTHGANTGHPPEEGLVLPPDETRPQRSVRCTPPLELPPSWATTPPRLGCGSPWLPRLPHGMPNRRTRA
jgi:hypothetical protein